MGNSLRRCLACVLPCGALDLIRVVHLNGYIDEFMGRITAAEVLKNNPNHVLTTPCSQGVARRIMPDSELKRGSIYFLIPAPADSLSSSSPRARRRISTKKTETVKKHDSLRSAKKLQPKVMVGAWHPNLDCIFEES